MADYWDHIIKDTGNISIKEFSEKASSFVKLTNKEIEEAIPQGIDQVKFADLMKVVNDAARTNKEKADQIRNISGFAEIAVNLLSKLV